MNNGGEAVELDLFPIGLGGSTPTSPLQYKVVPLDKPIAASFYKKHHYFGEKDFLCQYSFGALYEGELWGCITYGIPNAKNISGLYRSDEQHGVLEIVRMAFKPMAPKNSCSRMIKVSLIMLSRRYPIRLVITYADTSQGHDGGIYKASGFHYLGLTAPKTDFVGLDGKIRKMKGVKYSQMEGEWVPRSRKHLFSKRVQ